MYTHLKHAWGYRPIQAWREQEQQQWLPCSWQQLDLELQAAARRRKNTADWEVQLRAPVQQLEHLWRVRLQVSTMLSCSPAPEGCKAAGDFGEG